MNNKMKIEVWDGKQWSTKFSAAELEVYKIKKELEDVGIRCILVGDGSMPVKSNNLQESIIKALLSPDAQ
jgi:hypothetical protein